MELKEGCKAEAVDSTTDAVVELDELYFLSVDVATLNAIEI